jgi:GNAT superfamily N-acetyltransferase
MTDLSAPLIRSAEDDDRARLTELLESTWHDTWAPNLPGDADRNWRENRIAEVFIDQVWAFCLVAVSGGEIAGFAHLSSDEVTSLHVDPSAKRQGIGRSLMAAAETQLRSHGYGRLRVETEEFNTPAHAFYAALGYVETRRFIGDVIGHEIPCREFSKAL